MNTHAMRGCFKYVFNSPLGHSFEASLLYLTYWWSSSLDHQVASSLQPRRVRRSAAVITLADTTVATLTHR
jgi:hypothetical protein